jgi:hypothetical protein
MVTGQAGKVRKAQTHPCPITKKADATRVAPAFVNSDPLDRCEGKNLPVAYLL